MTNVNNIIFEASGTVRPRGNRWAACVQPSGITAFGQTQQEAIDHANEAVRLFIRAIQIHRGDDVARRYLDSHGISSVLIENGAVEPIRYRSEVRSSPEPSLAA